MTHVNKPQMACSMAVGLCDKQTNHRTHLWNSWGIDGRRAHLYVPERIEPPLATFNTTDPTRHDVSKQGHVERVSFSASRSALQQFVQ